ncbi:thiamine diphosphokinase [Enterococcus sp. BWT-B8]|uniref:thiamine diphosphokinase n=1 Tax=unclassified Enterococcus TaxID=2608891 RepID=UPI001E4624E9|nr:MULTISPECIES: thiamine diphosphokinase [unclassified Enterococcus]MCB5951178.1 thiamine diphosphokinase [Enterococcus sp. BWT-B8]MCB5954878.1 thiamine diphosphokinase [Enterococcus sp. CWB-B31]
MNLLIVAGGSNEEWPAIHSSEFDYFAGVDRGSLFILEQGWPLDLAVGDFDSLSANEKAYVEKEAVEVITSKPEKDDTDTQLALDQVFKRFPKATVTIIGATGGRLDHFLANLWLPLEERFRSYTQQIGLRDRQNSIRYFLPGEYTVGREVGMNYLAYCCLTPVNDLTLKDSKYLLNQHQVPVPTSYASNEFVGQTASFSFTSGVIAVIQSRD